MTAITNEQDFAKEPDDVIPDTILDDGLIDDAPVAPPMEIKVAAPIELKERPRQSITIDDAWSKDTIWKDDAITLSMPSNHDKEIGNELLASPKVELLDSKAAKEWAQAVSDGGSYTLGNEMYMKTLEDPTADFSQTVEYKGVKLGSRYPSFKPIIGQTLAGEKAALRVGAYLGAGTLCQTPLWSSGIWVTFKTPTDTELVELNRVLISDKIKFGRLTYGLSFSNNMCYTIDRLVTFALDHAFDTTVNQKKLGENQTLKDLILAQDIPSLLHGLVCSMFPKGFQYKRACTANPEKCNHVVQELLNLIKLEYTNKNALTEWQKEHMANRISGTKDPALLTKYRAENEKIRSRSFILKGEDTEATMTLKSPTIAEYIASGYSWISGLEQLVQNTLAKDATTNERNAYITRHGQATMMRQYVHWVESLEYDKNIVNTTETISKVFDNISGVDSIREAYDKYVTAYIDESTTTVIGIPVHDCPVCGGEQKATKTFPYHRNIIPLDVVNVFFALSDQKIAKIKARV